VSSRPALPFARIGQYGREPSPHPGVQPEGKEHSEGPMNVIGSPA
jgi:hypothetical protein